jgi:hypothetical protein
MRTPTAGVAAVPALLSWLRAQPGGAVGPLQVGTSKLGLGSGCFASQALVHGERLLAIPASAIIDLQAGSIYESFARDEGDRAALAAVLARQHLGDRSSRFAPYMAVLPQRSQSDTHVLWWHASEVELLTGTARQEYDSLDTEVREVSHTLRKTLLAAEVRLHGRRAVNEAVRAAYVSVLSRSFHIDTAERGEVQAMVPVLDLLQHSPRPSVIYATETCATTGGSVVVARSVGGHARGSELSIDYGSHPDFVFGTHYGFVPPLAQRRSSCYTTLCLGEKSRGRAAAHGAAAVLSAQDAARGTVHMEGPWSEAATRAQPDAALAAVLDAAGTASSWCVCRGPTRPRPKRPRRTLTMGAR